MTTDSPFLTLAEAADYMRVSTQTIRRWIKAGTLAAAKPGKEYRIRREDLDALR